MIWRMYLPLPPTTTIEVPAIQGHTGKAGAEESMHFCVDGIAGFKSPQLPRSVETGLRGLLYSDGEINAESLSKIPSPEDSNFDVVAEIQGYEIVADGSIALRAVIEGLRRRLDKPIAPNEKIRLVGE